MVRIPLLRQRMLSDTARRRLASYLGPCDLPPPRRRSHQDQINVSYKTSITSSILRRAANRRVPWKEPLHRKGVPWLLALFAGACCISVSAAVEQPAIVAFDRSFASINDYTCILRSHEVSGTKVQDRVYEYAFMKPHYFKTLILSGDGKGSGAVWTGGDQVSGHLGGILSGIHMKIGVHDPRTVSLHGVTIPDGLLPGIIDQYQTIHGRLTESDGGTIGGVATIRLDLIVTDPSSNHGITEQVAYFSKSSHWPMRQIMYSGSQIVLDESVSDLKTDVGLTKDDFPF